MGFPKWLGGRGVFKSYEKDHGQHPSGLSGHLNNAQPTYASKAQEQKQIDQDTTLGQILKEDMSRFVGQKVDQATLDDITATLELAYADVLASNEQLGHIDFEIKNILILKGNKPGQVKVSIDIRPIADVMVAVQ